MADSPRVLLIAWDSADWKLAQSLIDSGAMPALNRLIESGAAGKLVGHAPISPLINWTTVATGKTADKHGILGDFELDASGRLRRISRASRKSKALWNITSERGLRTHAVGWFGAVPCDEVNGVFVTSEYARSPRASSAIHPAAIEETIKALRLESSELPPSAILELIPRARETDQRYDDRLARTAQGLAMCCSLHNAATWILETEPWDFAAVYSHGIGYFSEIFMPYRPPRLGGISEPECNIYGGVVEAVYRFHDQMLARLVELAGEDAIVMLVSASGYEFGNRRPGRNTTGFDDPSSWRNDRGILCICGPGIEHDAWIGGATPVDVAPTVLALLNLPAGEDMDGRVLVSAFENPRAVPERIVSWESVPQGGAAPNSPGAKDLADQFLALDVTPARHPAEQQAKENLQFNLACVYMSTGRPGEALPILEKLFDEAPERTRHQRALAQGYLAARRVDEAERLLDNLLAGHETESWMQLLRGAIFLDRGRADAALERFRAAETGGERSAALHTLIGNAFLSKRMWTDAERSFSESLALDAEQAPAHAGLAAVRLRQGREQEAADHALDAVALRFEHPAAHLQLGRAMARLGRFDRAVVALEAALSLAPDSPSVRRYLSRVEACRRVAETAG